MCLLEDHFLSKNTKVYLPQYSDIDSLYFISSRMEVLCKKGFLKYFSKLIDVSGGIKMEHWPKMG